MRKTLQIAKVKSDAISQKWMTQTKYKNICPKHIETESSVSMLITKLSLK